MAKSVKKRFVYFHSTEQLLNYIVFYNVIREKICVQKKINKYYINIIIPVSMFLAQIADLSASSISVSGKSSMIFLTAESMVAAEFLTAESMFPLNSSV